MSYFDNNERGFQSSEEESVSLVTGKITETWGYRGDGTMLKIVVESEQGDETIMQTAHGVNYIPGDPILVDPETTRIYVQVEDQVQLTEITYIPEPVLFTGTLVGENLYLD